MPSNQQRREAAKRKLQRQLARREKHAVAMRRRLSVLGVVAAVLIVGGVVWILSSGSSDDSTTNDAAGACAYPSDGTAAKPVDPPSDLNPPTSGTVDATVALNEGDLTFALDRAGAPCAVNSFVSLANQQYFDDTECHRLTTSDGLKVLQCGDPSATGSGGPGYSFADELSGSETYTRGTLAMANSGADTNGSQFFIVYGDSQLDPNYTVLGTVTKGLDVVDAIAAKGVQGGGSDGAPAEAVTIESVTIAS